jgi:hypothetical protein
MGCQIADKAHSLAIHDPKITCIPLRDLISMKTEETRFFIQTKTKLLLHFPTNNFFFQTLESFEVVRV